jgi:photosystem II stability/assembly factor-like uncharacterized protein
MEILMTSGGLLDRSKKLFSFLLFYIVIASTNPVSYGQVSSEAGSIGDPARSPANSTNPNAIDTINTRIGSESHERVWQLTGPFGGDVTALAIDPRNADRILLGTSDGQIFRSSDGGEIWRRIRPGIKASGFMVTVILFDSERPNIIYAGVKAVTPQGEITRGGNIFISEDDGESWREFEGMRGRAVRGLVQSTKDANVLVAAALDGVYRTMDRGQSWKRITPENDPELRGFHSVAIDPRDVNIIFVGTNHLPWRTIDGGLIWNRAGSKETGMIDDSDIFAIHIDEANPETILMSACSGIYRATDDSLQWTKIQGIPYTSRRTHVIYQHPTRSDVIFAGTTEGLWLSTNHGKPDSWVRVTSIRLVINAVAIHPDRPDRVFLGTEDHGVLVSNDGGETYDRSNAGFINRQVRTVLADRKVPGRVYAGIIFDGSNSGLFISEDGGLSWQQSMSGMGVRDVYSLYQSPVNPETIYAGTNHGLFRSDDQGRSWISVKKEEIKDKSEGEPGAGNEGPVNNRPKEQEYVRPRTVKSIRKIVNTPSKKVSQGAKSQPKKKAGANVKSGSAKSAKSAKSVGPASTSAQRPNPNDPVDLQTQVLSLVPFTPRREVEIASIGESGTGDSTMAQSQSNWFIASTWDGLYRSEDEKRGWKRIKLRATEGAPSSRQPRINAVATSPHAPGLIYAGTVEGLYVSTDNGETFNMLEIENQVRHIHTIVFDPRTAETIYLGTSTGFFRSTDGGRSWENRGGGMALLSDVGTIAINTLNPDELYACDDLRNSFYHSKDRGKTWDKLDISQLPSSKLWSLSTDPFNPNRLYAASSSGGVYVMSKR